MFIYGNKQFSIMAFFTATAKQAGYVLAIIAVIEMLLSLYMYSTGKYDVASLAIAIILDLIVLIAGLGITKHNSKAYYVALFFVAIGFIFSILGIFIAAGVIGTGVHYGWIEAICDLILTGIMLGVLCFNKKEILG